MRNLAKAICATAALALPIPTVAQVTTTAFDGTYASVSRTLEGSAYGPGATTRLCWDSGVVAAPPGPLTIVNGFARWQGLVATFEGSVSPQGVVVMRNPRGIRFDGGIDSKGTVTGRITGNCSYWMVWRKNGG